jgi:hypothetical protein
VGRPNFSAHAKDAVDGFVVEIHLQPHIAFARTFVIQDLPEEDAELVSRVEKNLMACSSENANHRSSRRSYALGNTRSAISCVICFLARSSISSFTSGGNG